MPSPNPHPAANPEVAQLRRKLHNTHMALGVGAAIIVAGAAVLALEAKHGLQAPAPVNTAQAATAPKPQPAAPAVAQAASEPAAKAEKTAFQPPAANAIPEGPFGDMVRKGEQIFIRTGENAKEYVGNSLSCVNCHIDAGQLANSAPLWAAYVAYPQYRAKNKHVNDYAERLQGCFMYSMNGKAPERGSDTLVALETYSYWLATGAPINTKMQGGGYAKLDKPAEKPDFVRGQKVYAAQCALCHGAGGEGQRAGNTTVFPALWGDDSFNWGAGMGNINTAAGFIKVNMPFSHGNTLTDQEAWDVATFMDSQERPQDPRFDGDVTKTRKLHHDTPNSMYGMEVNSKVLGAPRT